jgi:hypothetical protein
MSVADQTRTVWEVQEQTLMQVGLMIPCYIDLFYPEVAVARSSLPERARRTKQPAPDVVRHPRITTVFVPSACVGDRP